MSNGKGGFGKLFPDIFEDPVKGMPDSLDDGGRPEGVGKPSDAGGGGRPSDAGSGGHPSDHGVPKGDLYGDQLVFLRDLVADPDDSDPDDDGDYDDGTPVLDINGNPIAVGYDSLTGTYYPIYYVGEEGDYELDPDHAEDAVEVELERANVARAPLRVMEKAYDAAMEKLQDAFALGLDDAGRVKFQAVEDGDWATIDAPLENLALYQACMTAVPEGADNSWTTVTNNWTGDLAVLAGIEGFDPSALLAGAWSKTGEITLDAMLYENTTLGINLVDRDADGIEIDYFSFRDEAGETYDYSRMDRYSAPIVHWWVTSTDPDVPPEHLFGPIFDVVFDADPDDGVFLGVDWADEYLVLNATGDGFDEPQPAVMSGANDFAQAADDSRAVIEFIHDHDAWVEYPEPEEMIDAA